MWMVDITNNIDNFVINDRLNDQYHNFYMGYIMRLDSNNFYHK